MKKILIVFCLLLAFTEAQALSWKIRPSADLRTDAMKLIKEFTENFPQDAKQYFTVHASPQKLNVNRLTLQQLRQHPYINYYQAKTIVDYRRLHGDIHSLQDLRFSRDFSPEAIRQLEPYVEY